MNEHRSFIDARTNIVRMVNGINILPTPLLETQIELSGIRTTEPDDNVTKNTYVQLDANSGVLNTQHDSWVGTVPVFYDRKDLGVLLKGVTVVWLTATVGSTQDFAKWARDNLGIDLNPEDIQSRPLNIDSDNGLFIDIVIEPGSIGWTGQTQVLLKKPVIELADILPPGTRLPVYVSPEKISSFKAYSYNYDWGAHQQLLERVVKEQNNGVEHKSLSGLLFGRQNTEVFDIHWLFTKVVGSEITAVGGHPKASILYLNKELDLWLHVGV